VTATGGPFPGGVRYDGGVRTLFLYSLLCVGVTALLLCWPVALVLLGGVFVGAWGWWMAGGALLLVALFSSTRLMAPYMRRLSLAGQEGSAGAALVLFVVIGAVAFVVAAITAGVAGPQLYHHYEGERTTAVVTGTEPARWSEKWRRGTRYHVVEHATERDLGWVERGPTEAVTEGARFEVSVDPRGYVNPVATERMGWTTVPTTIIVVCLGITAVAALFALAIALVMWPFAT
jgi:hypothetical protein